MTVNKDSLNPEKKEEKKKEERTRSSSGIASFLKMFFFKSKTSTAGTIIIICFILLMTVGPFVTRYGPYQTGPDQYAPPSWRHVLGTDYLGHDVLSQVIYGSYISMGVAILAAAGSAVIGLVAGVVAGYFKSMELPLAGLGDVLLTFPPLPLMILVGELYPGTATTITIILIMVLWPVVARAVRSQVLSLKERPYIEAARTTGMTNFQIVRRMIVPEVTSLAIAYFVLTISAAVVLVTALQFLGVGNPNEVSWGSTLFWAQQFAFYNGAWWWILAPGLSITLLALAFALLGFSVEETMNPRLRT